MPPWSPKPNEIKEKFKGEKRRFETNTRSLIFELPNKPKLEIAWHEFKTVEVTSFITLTGSNAFKFHFKEPDKSITVISKIDYSKKTLKKIRALLEKVCDSRSKSYKFITK